LLAGEAANLQKSPKKTATKLNSLKKFAAQTTSKKRPINSKKTLGKYMKNNIKRYLSMFL